MTENPTKYRIKFIIISMENNTSPKYWCYNCQRQSRPARYIQLCPHCQSSAIEEIDQLNQNASPSQFEVYQIHTPSPNTIPPPIPPPFIGQQQVFQFGPSTLMINTTGNQTQVSMSMPQMPLNMFNFGNLTQLFTQPGGIFNLINSLSGQRNLTAATRQQIGKLQVVSRVAECSICQQVQSQTEEGTSEQKQGYKLKCKHCFHKTCISPWFQKTNTCPTCREGI